MSLISSHHSPVDEGSNERLKSIYFDSRFAFNPLSTSPDMCVDSNVCILAWRAHPCPNYQTSSGPLSTIFSCPTIADKTQARHLWTSTLLIAGRCIPLFSCMRSSSLKPGSALSQPEFRPLLLLRRRFNQVTRDTIIRATSFPPGPILKEAGEEPRIRHRKTGETQGEE